MAKKSIMVMSTLAATGAGYLAGVLLAPKKGSELRNDVMGKAKMTTDKVSGRITQGKQKAQNIAADAQDKMKEIAHDQTRATSVSAHPVM